MIRMESKCPVCGNTYKAVISDSHYMIRCDTCRITVYATDIDRAIALFNYKLVKRKFINKLKGIVNSCHSKW